jgi:hypothetical protein
VGQVNASTYTHGEGAAKIIEDHPGTGVTGMIHVVVMVCDSVRGSVRAIRREIAMGSLQALLGMASDDDDADAVQLFRVRPNFGPANDAFTTAMRHARHRPGPHSFLGRSTGFHVIARDYS